jgi:hypothetical protein
MLILSDIAAHPILQPEEGVALALGLAAVLPADPLPTSTVARYRPALNQIRLTETGDITLDACAEPIAPGEEAQWLAEVIAALLGVDDLDENAHAVVPGGLLLLLARAMGRTSLPPLGYDEFLDGLERFSAVDAGAQQEIYERCRAQLAAPAVETASFAALSDPPAAGPTLMGEDIGTSSSSGPSLLWPQSVAHDDDVAFEREPSLFAPIRAPEPRAGLGRLSTIAATAAALAIVAIGAVVWLPQLLAKSPPETAVETLPAGAVWTESQEPSPEGGPPEGGPYVPKPEHPAPTSTGAPVRSTSADATAPATAPAPAAPPAVDPSVSPRPDGVPASEQLARSPDGTRLALLRPEPAADGVSNIWIADTGTGNVRRLTNHTLGRPAAASWFPDGTRIAYGVGDTLVIADVRGDESRRVKSPVPGRPVQVASVSADSSRIVLYVSGDGAWIYDLHSGQFARQ